MSEEERIYRFSVKPDIHNLVYIGSILLGLIVLPTFLILGDLSQTKIFIYLGLICIIIGILFWKVEKKFIFLPETGNLIIKTIRIKITWFSKTFLIKDCLNFDIQFLPQKNASFLILQHDSKKPYRIQFKEKNDEINFHLVNLNQMLSSVKSANFPSSDPKKETTNIEEIIASDKKRKITRDVDNNIVLSNKFIIFLPFIFPFLMVLVSYFFFGTESGVPSLVKLIIDLLLTLNCINLVHLIFSMLRVKDHELERINNKKSGYQLFKLPKFLQKLSINMNVIYIEPEQVSFYKKLRKGSILAGFIPIITSLVFFFLSLRK